VARVSSLLFQTVPPGHRSYICAILRISCPGIFNKKGGVPFPASTTLIRLYNSDQEYIVCPATPL
jgi:hypothetical protein